MQIFTILSYSYLHAKGCKKPKPTIGSNKYWFIIAVVKVEGGLGVKTDPCLTNMILELLY